jgi:Rho GTPase-activating protein 1
MDSFNLAMMICPNLVKGSNPVRDVMMCSVPVPTSVTGMSAGSVAARFASQESDSPDPNGNAENNTTLGMVVAFCIRRYYEIFDEITDRSEAVASWKTSDAKGSAEDGSGTYVLGEDEDLDDDAHVQNNGQRVQGPQPAAGEQTPKMPVGAKKHNNNNNPSISVQPIFNTNDRNINSSPFAWNKSSALNPHPTNGKARSLITIEGGNNTPIGTIMNRRGSIAIGRGTTRKGSGSAVEAVSVTAEGFFTPPGGVRAQVSTVSPSSKNVSSPTSDHDADGEDATLLSVSERKRIFENGGELTSTHP